MLGDGKPGHENQALGLTEALIRLRPCEVHKISLSGKRGPFARLAAARRAAAGLPGPAMIIAAGHATHLALLWLARKHRVPSVVLMRPSLPARWFDLCIAPAHDFDQPPAAPNILTTMGALNLVTASPAASRHGGLILVGGPSATHGWDGDQMLDALAAVADANPAGPWTLTDSRRTPAGFLDRIRERLPHVAVFRHQETTRDWLPACLAKAADVWVTEDSVSMVYEALSSGARVGLLPVPRKQHDTRVLRGLKRLIDGGWITPYTQWRETRTLAVPPEPLQEATRCAGEIVRLFFPPQPDRQSDAAD